MWSSDGEGRSIRSDARYPALSGEWEVPVTRNAKITPVNEGGGGGLPSGITFGRVPVTRNALFPVAGGVLALFTMLVALVSIGRAQDRPNANAPDDRRWQVIAPGEVEPVSGEIKIGGS